MHKAAQEPKTPAAVASASSPRKKAADQHKLDDMYARIIRNETGGETNPWIRTRQKHTKGGSTAYGPAQMTGTLVKDYLTRKPHLFTPEQARYAKLLVYQANQFKRHGNEKGKPWYSPIFDYGGRGVANQKKQHPALYRQVAQTILGDMYNRAGGDTDKVLRLWRGVPKAAAPQYYANYYRPLASK
jgi:hypothetical protein